MKKRERKRAKKLQAKLAKEGTKKMGKMSEKEIQQLEAKNKNRESLKMLIGDTVDESALEFQGNAEDPRFTELLQKNKNFALDPTHKDYHKMASGAFVKKQRKK